MSPRRLKEIPALCSISPCHPLSSSFLAFLLIYPSLLRPLFSLSLLCPPLPSSSQTPILSHLSGANGRDGEVGDKLITWSSLTCVRVKSSALHVLHRLLGGVTHTCNSAGTRHTTARNKYKHQNTYTPSYFTHRHGRSDTLNPRSALFNWTLEQRTAASGSC